MMYISVFDSCAGACLRDQMCFPKIKYERHYDEKDAAFHLIPLNVYLNKEEQYSCFCMLTYADSAKMEEKV